MINYCFSYTMYMQINASKTLIVECLPTVFSFLSMGYRVGIMDKNG